MRYGVVRMSSYVDKTRGGQQCIISTINNSLKFRLHIVNLGSLSSHHAAGSRLVVHPRSNLPHPLAVPTNVTPLISDKSSSASSAST